MVRRMIGVTVGEVEGWWESLIWVRERGLRVYEGGGRGGCIVISCMCICICICLLQLQLGLWKEKESINREWRIDGSFVKHREVWLVT